MKMLYRQVALRLPRLPAAMRDVCACLRFSFDKNTGKLRRRCQHIEDWDAFLWWTRRHCVLPTVYENLRRVAWDLVPVEAQSSLEAGYRRNSMRSLALAGETVRLIGLLSQAGIAAIPIKGQVLATQVYGKLSSRHAGDIDLLIAPENIDKADAILRGLGYLLDNSEWISTPVRRQVILRNSHHRQYSSAENRFQVEVHWRLSDVLTLPLQFDWLWAHGERMHFSNRQLTVLPDLHNLLFLCVHGAVHGWSRLQWLCDIAHSQFRRTADWLRLLALARRLNAARPVLQAAMLVQMLLHLPLPEAVLTEVNRDPALFGLTRHSLELLCSPHRLPRTLREKRTYWLHRAGLRNALSHKLRTLCLTHNAADWVTVPLPDALFVLYYPMRPLLWMAKQVQRFANGSQ